MNLSDELFKKVEKKTKIKKDTIISLAEKLNNGNMKDEKTIREVISTLSQMTGKDVSKEKEDKIASPYTKEEKEKSKLPLILIIILVVLIAVFVGVTAYNNSKNSNSSDNIKISDNE